jgi:hypothetical protein
VSPSLVILAALTSVPAGCWPAGDRIAADGGKPVPGLVELPRDRALPAAVGCDVPSVVLDRVVQQRRARHVRIGNRPTSRRSGTTVAQIRDLREPAAEAIAAIISTWLDR